MKAVKWLRVCVSRARVRYTCTYTGKVNVSDNDDGKGKRLTVSELGRLGGLASAKAMTRGERVEKARAAARARWARWQIYCDRGNGPELEGCWGSENARFTTQADALEACKHLEKLYPDCKWVVQRVESTDERNGKL